MEGESTRRSTVWCNQVQGVPAATALAAMSAF